MNNNNINNIPQVNLPGQPTPIDALFIRMRNAAMSAPILKPQWTIEEVSVEKHAHAFDYNNNFILGVVLLCILRDNKFLWHVQSAFVSKKTGKYISIGLLPKREVGALSRAQTVALGNSKSRIAIPIKKQLSNALIWESELSKDEYATMNPAFLELVEVESETE